MTKWDFPVTFIVVMFTAIIVWSWLDPITPEQRRHHQAHAEWPCCSANPDGLASWRERVDMRLDRIERLLAEKHNRD